MAKRQSRHLLLLFIQIAITFFYSIAIIQMTVVLFTEDRDIFISGILGYLSQGILLIIALVPQIVLRLKRKIHTQDGEIYPLLFTVLALQASLIIPQYTKITGTYILDPSSLLVLERFAIVCSASIFLLSALRFYGLVSSRRSLHTFLVIGSALILCILAPINSNQEIGHPFMSSYDAYLQMATLLMYVATIATMIISATKDKTASNTKRCISFICFIIGLYLAATSSLIPVLFSILLYIGGIVLLISSTEESF